MLILVKLNNNKDYLTGTQAAGPIFSDLVDATLKYMNVPPNAVAVSLNIIATDVLQLPRESR